MSNSPTVPCSEAKSARLTGAAGPMLAEVADDEVTGSLPDPESGATNGAADPAAWRTAVAWREVEIELGSGPARLLDEAGRVLLAAGAQPSPAASKLALLLSAAGPAGRDG